MWGAAAATAVALLWVARTTVPLSCGVDGTFCKPHACARLRVHLDRRLHGQAAAVDLLSDAVCDHVENPRPGKPLVASLHGSPGVGKSTFHRLLAQALYDAADEDYGHLAALDDREPNERSDPGDRRDDEAGGRRGWVDAATGYASDALGGWSASWRGRRGPSDRDGVGRAARRGKECPGRDCPGYKVIFGTDYVTSEQEAQGRMLRDAVLEHLRVFPEAVVVIEEYDKMGCPARGVLKQLLDKGAAANATFHRAVFVLEANVGFVQIHRRLQEAVTRATRRVGSEDGERKRDGIDADVTAMQRSLRDLMFERWLSSACEERSDTHKAVSAVDLFVPFFPLDRSAVAAVIETHLQDRAAHKTAPGGGELRALTWRPGVVTWLVEQVEFEREFAIEGGKEAPAVLSRWVTRAIRVLAQERASAGSAPGSGGSLKGARVEVDVSPERSELVARVVDDDG